MNLWLQLSKFSTQEYECRCTLRRSARRQKERRWNDEGEGLHNAAATSVDSEDDAASAAVSVAYRALEQQRDYFAERDAEVCRCTCF